MIQILSLSLSQTTSPTRLCAFWCRAEDLGFVICWSLGSLPPCLRISRVGLSVTCWECWVVRRQLTQKHNCQNVSETEWPFAIMTLQVSLGCLLDMFPRHILHTEVLVINPYVNLRRPKKIQTLHCCEKQRLASCTSTKLEKQTRVIQVRTINLLTLMLNLASRLQMKLPGTSQVLQSSIWLATWQKLSVILCLIDVIYQSLATLCRKLCSILSLMVPGC